MKNRTTDKTKAIKKHLNIVKMGEEKSDFVFWKKQTFEQRLRALEEIRSEYNKWRYGVGQEFQRVYRVIKQK